MIMKLAEICRNCLYYKLHKSYINLKKIKINKNLRCPGNVFLTSFLTIKRDLTSFRPPRRYIDVGKTTLASWVSTSLPVYSTHLLFFSSAPHTPPSLYPECFLHSNSQILNLFFAPPAHLRAAGDWRPFV